MQNGLKVVLASNIVPSCQSQRIVGAWLRVWYSSVFSSVPLRLACSRLHETVLLEEERTEDSWNQVTAARSHITDGQLSILVSL